MSQYKLYFVLLLLTIWGSLELKSKNIILPNFVLSPVYVSHVMFLPGVLWPMHTAFTRGPKDVCTFLPRTFHVGTGQDLGLSSPSRTWQVLIVGCDVTALCEFKGTLPDRTRPECSACARRPQNTAQWIDHDKLDLIREGVPAQPVSAWASHQTSLKTDWWLPGAVCFSQYCHKNKMRWCMEVFSTVLGHCSSIKVSNC